MNKEILLYNDTHAPEENAICHVLADAISANLPQAENKIWHGHPVWFIDGNPVTGYSKLKDGIRLLFWSGQTFEEPGLTPEGKFKAAEKRYKHASEIQMSDLQRWLEKAQDIQWDYKNLIKRKGELLRLK